MEVRYLEDWLDHPLFEETVCKNEFRDVFETIYRCGDDAFCPIDFDLPSVKISQLIREHLVLLDGDAIYVREGENLHLLNDAYALLAGYMHVSIDIARKAADLITANFSGAFPISDGHILRDCIAIDNFEENFREVIDLTTLEPVTDEKFFGPRRINPRWSEFGASAINPKTLDALTEFFSLINSAIGANLFAEKMLMYPFHAPLREKAFVLKGGGGNGKSLLMSMLGKLYGKRAYIDAPQPKFSGHDSAVIAHSLVGRKVISFNDVDSPSSKFLEWLKRMITGNLEVKTPSGVWLSVPCAATFYMETNHQPNFLDNQAHKRRFIYKELSDDFKIAEEMSSASLDLIGDRSDLSAADIVWYLMSIKNQVTSWSDLS